MENTPQPHIEQAFQLYKKLLSFQADFICQGIERYYLDEKFEKDQLCYIIFYYLYNHIQTNAQEITDDKIEILLSGGYKDLNISLKGKKNLNIKLQEGRLTIEPKDKSENIVSLLRVPDIGSPEVGDLLDVIKENFKENNSFNRGISLPSSSLDFTNKEEPRHFETLQSLFQYIEQNDPEILKKWYMDGIENLSCKIFNEFVLSLTLADYIQDANFTSKLGKFGEELRGCKWAAETKSEPILPQLIQTINIMAVHYQLFCRQVQSQLIRKPDELYFCMTRNIQIELDSVPILGLCKFKPDNSEKFVHLFSAILDVCFIDHRFILEQQTVERLIYSLETIKNLGEKYFNISAAEWKINEAEAHNLEQLEIFAHSRKGATKLILKLVYAKACTLWSKMHFFLQNPPSSTKEVAFPSIKIIDRQDIKPSLDIANFYSESIIGTSFQNSEELKENISSENIQYIRRLNTALIHNCQNDIELYNKQVTNIRLNYLWFKEKERDFDDYKNLKPQNVRELYDEYRQRKINRKPDDIIFFSDKFLVAALDVINNDINQQLEKIGDKHIVPTYDMLHKVNESINFFSDLIEELKKLAEFSEKFGLMENQHLFGDSFYSPESLPETEAAIPLKYKRESYSDKIQELNKNMKCSWLFMASANFLPAYPNHYKRLYEAYKEKRRAFSTTLYMDLPYFLNRNTQQDIAKERNNSIQIMAVFATIMAFVTASVGALKILETSEGYTNFACIFCLSLLSFVAIIRLFTVDNSRILYNIIAISLCVLGLHLTPDRFVQSILCLVILIAFTYGINEIFEHRKEKTDNSDKKKTAPKNDTDNNKIESPN